MEAPILGTPIAGKNPPPTFPCIEAAAAIGFPKRAIAAAPPYARPRAAIGFGMKPPIIGAPFCYYGPSGFWLPVCARPAPPAGLFTMEEAPVCAKPPFPPGSPIGILPPMNGGIPGIPGIFAPMSCDIPLGYGGGGSGLLSTYPSASLREFARPEPPAPPYRLLLASMMVTLGPFFYSELQLRLNRQSKKPLPQLCPI